MRSERHHQLKPTDNGNATMYTTYEKFWGPLKPLMPFRHTDQGFKEQANQLKKYCEETGPAAPTQEAQ
ncbi:MAG: hypothetical protein ACI9C1_001518 [Candidatus Aldehydirespiratoraceae bacterium]|jgi:hypothetical protein